MIVENDFFKPREVFVEEFNSGNGGVLKLRIESPHEPANGWRFAKKGDSNKSKRGKVRGFSSKSRKNISDNVQILDYNSLTHQDTIKSKFITLTYPKNFPNIETAKIHLQNLFKRLKRKFPKCSAVWKYEPQKRGAPHFHIMLYNLPFLAKEDLSNMWLEIIGDEFADYSQGFKRAPMTRIETIRSTKGCSSYISKYIAKIDGSKGELSSPLRSAGFNSLPYLTAKRFNENIELIDEVMKRALDAGESFQPRYEYDINSELKLFLDSILKKYLTPAELDILCPSIGRVWGKFNRKYMVQIPKKNSKFLYNVEVIRCLKDFCHRSRERDFNKNYDDGGFTFYFNNIHELNGFYEVYRIVHERESLNA
jgi:hypothetical protein